MKQQRTDPDKVIIPFSDGETPSMTKKEVVQALTKFEKHVANTTKHHGKQSPQLAKLKEFLLKVAKQFDGLEIKPLEQLAMDIFTSLQTLPKIHVQTNM